MSKLAQISAVDEGARALGVLLESVYGRDWRPVGNGTYRDPERHNAGEGTARRKRRPRR